MNTYTITIETTTEDVVHVIEAAKCSVNYLNEVIEAIIGEGKFTVIKLPEDWTTITADEVLGEEEQAELNRAKTEAMMAQQMPIPPGPGVPLPADVPVPPVPSVPVVPPGQ